MPVRTVQFKINLTDELKDKLEACADRARRSIAAEIIYRLELTFDEAGIRRLTDYVNFTNQFLDPDKVEHTERSDFVASHRPWASRSTSASRQVAKEDRSEPTPSRSRVDMRQRRPAASTRPEVDARLERLETSQNKLMELITSLLGKKK